MVLWCREAVIAHADRIGYEACRFLINPAGYAAQVQY